MDLSINDITTLTMAWLQSPDYVEMTDRQKVVFGIICDQPGPHHVRNLARLLGVDKYVITRICDKLSETGLIVRAATPGDRRDCTIEPTAHGAEVRARMRALRVQ